LQRNKEDRRKGLDGIYSTEGGSELTGIVIHNVYICIFDIMNTMNEITPSIRHIVNEKIPPSGRQGALYIGDISSFYELGQLMNFP
jgi:hypothetical protein